jgi:hypothetical protein
MNIYEKLQKARCVLQDKKLKKSGKNNYSGFTYFELSDFLPITNQIFAEIGLCPRFCLRDTEAYLTIYDTESDAHIEFATPTANAQLKGCTDIQALGAVHTYLKRYLYLNALEIVESDALDPLAGSDKIEEKEEIDDFEILSNVDNLNTSAEISNYFNTYNKVVSNKSAFIKAINNRRKQLSSGE